MRETEKPQLDAQALEAAHKVTCLQIQWCRQVIEAYLAALPPAKHGYMSRQEDGSLGWIVMEEARFAEGNVRVEIREVSQS